MMTPTLVVGIVLLGADLAGAPAATVEALRSYDSAQARAGRDPEAHVRLALWCEGRGLAAERTRHLALAVLIDPANARARGLMGLVDYRGKWERPGDVGEKIKADPELGARLAEYNTRRDALEVQLRSASRSEAERAHVKLGMWCEANGLQAEATAHFTSAVVLNPYHDATWKHLGYLRHNGRWMSREQIAAEGREASLQRKADRHWEPFLRKWSARLADESSRPEARDRLAEVTDPRAVPAIVRTFRDRPEAAQKLAVQLLGQIDSPRSTRELASLALSGSSATVRAAAIRVLQGRSPRDYAGDLVDMIHKPARYFVEPVFGPGSPGALVIETPRFRMFRTYDAPPLVSFSSQFYGYVGYDANGLPVVARGAEVSRLGAEKPAQAARDLAVIEARTAELMAEARWKAAVSQQRLFADVSEVEASNQQAAAVNERVIPVLEQATGTPGFNDDEDAWHVWWYDQLGYRYQPPAQVVLAVNASPQAAPPHIYSCFVAGTLVRTLEGRRPIDGLRVGDRVLSQDAVTGSLSYQPILVVHHNNPGGILKVALDNGETLEASVYHRFWRAGRGWAMARELEAGDVLRTLDGLARVDSIHAGPAAPLFNLDVAGGRTFFVGAHDTLVHDNTLPDPHATPFDAELAATTPPGLDAAPGRD